MSKKWILVVLIGLGIGWFWVSNNLWLFDIAVTQEEYQEKIIGSWVNDELDLYFWEENNALTTSGIQEIGRWEKRRLYWQINDNSINIYGKYIPDSFRKSCSQNNIKDCLFDDNLAQVLRFYD